MSFQLTEITKPTHEFELRMLDPDYWKPNSLMSDIVISTDEWSKMQRGALDLLNNEWVFTVSPRVAIEFWRGIVHGKVPKLLQVVGPGPSTKPVR